MDWIDLGSLYTTRVVYPFIDPLHYLFPPVYVPYLGAPDLVNDFYHGRTLDRALFLREVYAEYHLYQGNPQDRVAMNRVAPGGTGARVALGADAEGAALSPRSRGRANPLHQSFAANSSSHAGALPSF